MNMRSRIYKRRGALSAVFRILVGAALLGCLYAVPAVGAGNDVRNSIVNISAAQVGKPYSMVNRLGPNSFDCSGLVYYAYTNSGVSLHNSLLDWTAYPIDRSDIRPGDLVYLGYETRNDYDYSTGYHVGIYIGNGQVVDARGSSSGVVRRSFDDLAWTWIGRVPARNWPAGDDGVAYAISNSDYVASLYEILLGREPAPSERDSWVSVIVGGETRYDVAREVTKSREYCESVTALFYTDYLGRNPNPAELKSWADQLTVALRVSDMRTAFLVSDEYYGKVGSEPTLYVRFIYRAVLGRNPLQQEEAGWAAQIIDAATRAGVAANICTSDEARTRFIQRTYYNLLGAVDGAGQSTWLNAMRQGMDEPVVQAAMFSSSEFVNSYMNNKRFVIDLYRYFLGRDPDAAGLKFWTDALNSGLPRQNIPAAFVNSTEHHYHTVNGLYLTILGRSGESAGVWGWVRALDSGTSPHVVEALFYGSDEYLGRLPTRSNRQYVMSLYQAILGRLPVGGEENGWGNLLDQGQNNRQSIAAIFMNTYEHHYRFVFNCYQHILKRQPDVNETQGWIRAMNSGIPEDAIEAGFFSSAEYKPVG